jgi:hypothetical protein
MEGNGRNRVCGYFISVELFELWHMLILLCAMHVLVYHEAQRHT